MHQTFYIDIDEEISSVIDRIRKAVSQSSFLVVPKRAIFLQSIVNLKLLKREADKIGKEVIIVTQDEIGISMAKKCGLKIQEATDPLEEVASDSFQDEEGVSSKNILAEETQTGIPVNSKSKKTRLSVIGTNDFYGKSAVESESMEKKVTNEKMKNNNTYSERKIAIRENVENRRPQRKVDLNGIRKPMLKSDGIRISRNLKGQQGPFNDSSYEKKLEPSMEKAVEKMFLPSQSAHPFEDKISKDESGGHASKKMRNFFIGFFLVCGLMLAGVAGYLLVPSAKISITPNVQKKKIDLSVFVGNDIGEKSENIVPVRTIEKEEKLTVEYAATGRSALSGSKARGSVVIYNEYSGEPQTLVATTRIQSANGKIFRLEKNIIVPGTNNIGGEVKPGAITAEVVADEPGGDYNVEPTNFTIPGFKGGPKFEKFYAKSTNSISGGSSNGDTSLAVSQSDIDSAKIKTEAELEKQILENLNQQIQSGEILLDQARRITKTSSFSGAKVGDLSQKIEHTAVASVKALVFSENDIRKIIENKLDKERIDGNPTVSISKIEYGGVSTDFENNSIEFKVYVEVSMLPMINTEELKRELLGKDEVQYNKIFNKYPTIKNAKIEFNPAFVARIPQYAKRVLIEVENVD